jgi:hypothetical protein
LIFPAIFILAEPTFLPGLDLSLPEASLCQTFCPPIFFSRLCLLCAVTGEKS